jgi:hypothetical protein
MSGLPYKDMEFMLKAIGTFWEEMPEEDKTTLMNIWRGYAQITSDLYAQLYQYDYSKSLEDIQYTTNRLWRKYDIWNNFEFDYLPDFTNIGLASTKFEYGSSLERISCEFDRKGGWDKKVLDLTSNIDQYANLYWQVNITPTDSGVGGLVGYFDSYSSDLTNTLAIAWGEGRILGLLCDSTGDLYTSEMSSTLTADDTYVLTATYMATGGSLKIDLYNSQETLLDTMTMYVDILDFPNNVLTVSTSASGVSGMDIEFSADTFGIANINTANNIETFNSLFLTTQGNANINSMGYTDPSIITTIQSIPTMQTQLDAPLFTLISGTDYILINNEVHYIEVVPAEYLWAKDTYHDNSAVEKNFGFMVRYEKLESVHTNEEYLAGVQGLWYSYLYGPTINNIETGLAILAREPFSRREGTISSITKETPVDTDAIAPFTYYSGNITAIYSLPSDTDYSYITINHGTQGIITYFYLVSVGRTTNPTTGNLWQVGDTVPAYTSLSTVPSGQIKVDSDDGTSYIYDFRQYVGVGTNPSTKETFAVGDEIDKFQVLTDALQVVDWKSHPTWWIYHLLIEEDFDFTIQRFKSFGVRLKPLYMPANSLSLMVGNFINHIKPVDTRVWFTKQDDTPLFIIGNYEHVNYVNVAIIGDQNIYLPADFIYEDSTSAYIYGYQAISGQAGPTSDPSYLDVPTTSIIYPPYVFQVDYLPGTDIFKGDATEGSLVYLIDSRGYVSSDSGVSWSRILNSAGNSPAELALGRSVVAQHIFYLSSLSGGSNLYLGGGIEGNSVQVFATADDKLIEGPSSAANVGFDIDTRETVAPLQAKVLYADSTNLSGHGLLVASRNSDRTKLGVTRMDVASPGAYARAQTSDLEDIPLGRTTSDDLLLQTLNVDTQVSSSLNVVIKAYAWLDVGSTTPDYLTAALYTNSGTLIDVSSNRYKVGPSTGTYTFTFDQGTLSPGTYRVGYYRTGAPNSNKYFILKGGVTPGVPETTWYEGVYRIVDGTTVGKAGSFAFSISAFVKSIGQEFELEFPLLGETITATFELIKVNNPPDLHVEIRTAVTYNLLYTGSSLAAADFANGVATEASVTLNNVSLDASTQYVVALVPDGAPDAANFWRCTEGGNSLPGQDSMFLTEFMTESAATDIDLWCTLEVTDMNLENDPYFSASGTVIFPDDYITLTNLGNLPLTGLIDSVYEVSSSMSMVIITRYDVRVLVYIPVTNTIVMWKSVNEGVSWTEVFSETVSSINGEVGVNALWCDRTFTYFYFKDDTTGKDYLTVTKDNGENWSVASLLSPNHKFLDTAFPSFVSESGDIKLIGLDTGGVNLLTYSIKAS